MDESEDRTGPEEARDIPSNTARPASSPSQASTPTPAAVALCKPQSKICYGASTRV